MGGDFPRSMADRKARDRQNLHRLSKSIAETVFALQPDLGVEQVGAHLTAGGDDPFRVSGKGLYDAMEGHRKFPAHKIALLSELDPKKRVIKELARQSNVLVFEPPKASDFRGPENLRAAMKDFAAFVDAHCDAVCPEGPGGAELTEGENESIQTAGRKLIEEVLAVLAGCNASTQRGNVARFPRETKGAM